MTLTSRYSTIDKAIITATGNSIVICGSSTELLVNTSDMIKPDGSTTRDYNLSGSSAKINILDNSTILYAEVVWLSTVKSIAPGALDVRSLQDDPITFTTPNGTFTLSPDLKNSYTSPSGTVDRLRSANVTNIIKTTLSGTYTVSKVPTSIPTSDLSEVRAGWSLVVIYRNDSFKPKRIVYALGIEAATSNNPLQIAMTGFMTDSDQSTLNGSLTTVVANGNPIDGYDTVKIGPSFAQLTTIGNPFGVPSTNPGTSPNNPWNSFSSGQINIADPLSSNRGLIDINGTNGTNNHDAFLPAQVIGARNKWDITTVNISNTLVANQSQLSGQYNLTNTTNSIEVVSLGTQVDAVAPDITATLDAYDVDGDNEYNLNLNERLVYVVQVKNNGKSTANNIILSTILNPAIQFVPNSVTINGVTQIGADITSSVNVGNLEPAGVTNVSFTIKAISLVQGGGTANTTVNYNYSFSSNSQNYINYCNTNSLNLIIQDGNLNVVKSVSSQTTTLGETLVYTTEITNTGSETTLNMLFQDKINKYCTFVPGTVAIDGTTRSTYNPNNGFALSDLNPNEKTTVTFSVTVNSVSPNTVVENGALVTFSYIFNQYVVPITKTIFSNNTNIQIQFTDIVARRTANNYYPSVLDTVTYTLKLSNIGNIAASNVQVVEPHVPGTTFVNGSVYINGIRQLTYNPFEGFVLSSIAAQATTTITYQVLVNELQPDQIIENIAKIPFKYQISPDASVISSEKDSNKVTTKTNFVTISIDETVDKDYATINDILYYSVTLTNTGNIDAINTTFLSAIQLETTFIPNTVAINGLIQTGYNPTSGFSVGTISPGNSVTVTFQARVNSVPTPNIIYNSSELIYSYKPDPNGSPITNTITSNKVQTVINTATFSITKTVDKAYASIGEYLVYRCSIENTGTVDLSNVYFSDEISTYVNFVPGTVNIDGVSYPDAIPDTGIRIGTINPGETVDVLFGVQILTAPPFGYVMNMGEMSYNYRVNPNSPIISETKKSNTVQTKVINGNLSLTKYTSLSYATIDDVINYSIEISNTGNVTVNNTFFFDDIPNGVSFIPSSVVLNGISKPSYNPVTGFNIGTLNAGQVVTINFNVKVNSVPSPNTITNNASTTYNYVSDPNMPIISKTSTSNNVTTTINKGSATLSKVVDKTYATINDIVTYTITANNTGTVTLSDIFLTDLIASGSTFNAGSVIIDGVTYDSYNPNIGFSVPNILAGGSSVISFKSTITSVPTPPQVDNQASINYKYKISPNGTNYSSTATSNTTTTYINKATITNTKTVSKSYAEVLDTLTYTSVIKNTGNINITNTNFVDILEPELTFTPSSVTINGTPYSSYNPNIGFTIGTIAPNDTVTVVFTATVSLLPDRGYVNNKSTIYYNYKINPSDPDILTNKDSNTVTTYIKSGTLTITKNSDRYYAKLNDTLEYSIIIANTGNTQLSTLSFQDTIQSESTFNTGSVKINGISKSSYNPNDGFQLDNLAVGNSVTISFTVTVNALPSDYKIYNTGTVTYSYYVDPAQPVIVKNKTSNKTTVIINNAIVTATKSVDKTLAKIGNILNFSIDIVNTGSVPAKFVNFTDLLDSNITFNDGSVKINGTPYTNYNPNDGFTIDDIANNSTTTVTFAATIISRPSDNMVKNFATINYSYKVNPDDPYIEVTIDTNNTTTYVAVSELTLHKSVDKLYATVGDNLNYTVNVKNTGSINATNITFKDLNPNDSTFIPHSVIVDGVLKTDYDPNTGFIISDLVPNQSHTVSFNVKVNTLPSTGIVENTADSTFNYKLIPTDPTSTMTSYSNKVTTTINLGKLTVTKSVNKVYATIGDTVSYSISVQNIGNVPCTNIFFQDIIQPDANFIDGTVKINNISKSNYNPNTGFNLDDIAKNIITTITFDVVVKTLPYDYYLRNTATANYNYIIDPANQPISTSSTSNTTSTTINLGRLSVTKETNKTYATIDDTVSYTVTIINTGNIDANFVNFRDVVPDGLTFVIDSVTINGVSRTGIYPNQSFTLGNISPGESSIVKFDTKVTSVPTPSLISNTANIVFSYKINPNEDYIVKQTDSNAVTTQINLGKLTVTKSRDKGYATIGDILTYTIEITNSGNVNVTDVLFTDGIQSNATFLSGSVTIDGDSKPTYNPLIGFSLGSLEPLDKVTVVFKVTIKSLPSEYTIINIGTATFSYKINPTGETYSKSTQSNTVSTIIIVAGLTASKVVNLVYATVSDILDYSITVKNTGNATNKSLFFIDTLSSGGTFESGSVVVDGFTKTDYNPITGFNIPNLLPGTNSVIAFKAKVTSLPVPPQVTNYATTNGVYKIDPEDIDYQIGATSNTVSTQINVGNLTNVKSVDKMYAKLGDTITYTNVITNVGNISALSTQFFDTLQNEVQFISGTVRINGVLYPSFNPTIGFTLGDLVANQVVTVSFDVKINTLPTPPQVINSSRTQFDYRISPVGNLITKTITSNTVTTNVVKGELTVTKAVDKTIATIGDILTFDISITNVGNVSVSEVFFQDTPSTGATFKSGSVIINGVPNETLDPTLGFSLNNIAIGNVTTIQFKATVISVPSSNKVTNQANVNFKFLIDPKDPPFTTTTTSNTTTTNIALGSLNVTKAVDKQFATKGQTLTYTVVVINTGNINATNVVFLDPTPQNSIFTVGSVIVNGVNKPNYNPSVGFNLDVMKPGEIITVVYQVEVI